MTKDVVTIIPGRELLQIHFYEADGMEDEIELEYSDLEDFAKSFRESELVCTNIQKVMERNPDGYYPTIFDIETAKQLLAKSVKVKVEAQPETHQELLAAYKTLQPKLDENGLDGYYREHCLPLNCITWQMAKTGVTVDVSYLKQLKACLEKILKDLHKELEEIAGKPFPCNEAGIRWLLYQRLKVVQMEDGKQAVNQKVLSSQKENPHLQKVCKIRELKEALKSIDALLDSVAPDGRIHPKYNLFNTETGRISVSDPPLQGMPVHSPLGKLVRKAIVAPEDYILLDADYSQIELRVLAGLSGDRNMIADYQNDVDLHRYIASRAYKIAIKEVSDEQRSKAKAVGFGIIYGRGIRSLQAELKCSMTEAKELKTTFLESYPAVGTYRTECEKSAREKGYAETILGLRRELDRDVSGSIRERRRKEAAFNRKAFNTVIQGSAGDIFGNGVIKVFEELRRENLQASIVLLVFDEILVQAKSNQAEEVKEIIETGMKAAWKMEVPLKVDVETGDNWSVIH